MKEIKLRDFQMRGMKCLEELPVILISRGKAVAVIDKYNDVDDDLLLETEEVKRRMEEIEKKIEKIERLIERSRGY